MKLGNLSTNAVFTGMAGTLVLAGLVSSTAAYARQCDYPFVCKQARSDERAVSEYILNKESGLLTRMMEADGGQRDGNPRDNRPCAAASNVVDFKISQHQGDAAAIYFIKSYDGGTTGDLYYLPKSDQTQSYSGGCPAANARVLMRDIKKTDGRWEYGVVTSSDTHLVNYALSRSGTFTAWPRSTAYGSPVSYAGVVDTEGNPCYDRDGKRFASKIVFLKDANGGVYAVENSGAIKSYGRFGSINEFQRRQRFMAEGQCLNSDGSQDYLLNPGYSQDQPAHSGGQHGGSRRGH